MNDTIDNINTNTSTDGIEKTIRPLEMQGRVALFVYYNSYKGTKQLTRFGDLGYSSRKAHYSVLYVNEEKVQEITEQLYALKFVKKVRPSHLKELNTNFSEAFTETNLELKKQLQAALEKI